MKPILLTLVLAVVLLIFLFPQRTAAIDDTSTTVKKVVMRSCSG